MTPQQRDLVQASFVKIAPSIDHTVRMFYDDLFRRDPDLRALFLGDMALQHDKFVTMLATAIAHLKKWDAIEASIQALGRRHFAYGAKPSDYETVGAALIATLETELGEDFTPAVREAWLAYFHFVSAEMIAAEEQ